MSVADNRAMPPLSLRHSIAPRVLDNSVPMATLVSTSRFSVRVAPPEMGHCTANANILTTFIWRDPGASVFLAGSFDDWRKHKMIFVPDVKYHILVTELPPGEYAYRFVVDGRWRVAEGDPNLREDQFEQLSHFITISSDAAASATPKRFSTVAVAHTELEVSEAVVDEGHSDTESERSFDEVEDAPDAPMPPEAPPAPRRRGDSTYIRDYDDDEYAGLDLQADVFEAMKDVAEVNEKPHPREGSPSQSQSTIQDTMPRRRPRQRPGVRVLRRVWAMLFGDSPPDENAPPNVEPVVIRPTHNQKVHGLVTHENALKKGLKVWFPNERNCPPKSPNGRKIAPSETRDVLDAGDRALKLHQVEENANNRQMLGKNLFAQGKYDAALALFSLSVKLREDNGLKYAKTTAIAHTDVASAFIHLEDLKNAEKHLNNALAIFNKSTFSGGKAQLGDVHCFLGVIGDMRGDLTAGETAYRQALDLYEKCKATDENPNYATAIENLSANVRRQRALGSIPVATAGATSNQVRTEKPPKPAKASRAPPKAKNPPKTTHAAKTKAIEPPKRIQKAHTPMYEGADKSGGYAASGSLSSTPLEPSRPPPQLRDSPQSNTGLTQESNASINGGYSDSGEVQNANQEMENENSNRPNTWKGLADTARASMPAVPPEENVDPYEDDLEPPAGSYEEMCRAWHKDAQNLLGNGKYKEAIDLYTLAVYTRKRHGPWVTRENADTLVEHARALFATRDLAESVQALRDAIGILEKMNKSTDQLHLGEVWGNLGSVLDRLGGHESEALAAHCAGMVMYGKSGMSSEDVKWTKAWKGLCMHLKMTDRMEKSDEMWRNIDLQIRGVEPVTKVATVVLHR